MRPRVILALVISLAFHGALLYRFAAPANDEQLPEGAGSGIESSDSERNGPDPDTKLPDLALPVVRLAGTVPAVGVPQSAVTANAGSTGGGDEYLGLVRARLSQHARVLARRLQQRGAVEVAFAIAADGSVHEVGLSRSSGSAELDQAALALVQGSSPLPSPTAGLRLRVPIEFH